MITAIQKWGNSQGIRLPKSYLDAIGLDVNDSVEILRNGDDIVVHKIKKSSELTLEDIFEGYNGDYKATEADWGERVGSEEW